MSLPMMVIVLDSELLMMSVAGEMSKLTMQV